MRIHAEHNLPSAPTGIPLLVNKDIQSLKLLHLLSICTKTLSTTLLLAPTASTRQIFL